MSKGFYITITFLYGEAPDKKELRDMGMTLDDYAIAVLDDISLPGLDDYDAEIKGSIKEVKG